MGSANYVVRALIQKGLVKEVNFKAAEDKRRYSYILTPNGLAEKAALTGRFLAMRLEDHQAWREEIDELRSEVKVRSGEGFEVASVGEDGGR